MKQLTGPKQKWLLSTLLIAALGSQYIFQVSSNELQSIELSSMAADAISANDHSNEMQRQLNRSKNAEADRAAELRAQQKKEAEQKTHDEKDLEVEFRNPKKESEAKAVNEKSDGKVLIDIATFNDLKAIQAEWLKAKKDKEEKSEEPVLSEAERKALIAEKKKAEKEEKEKQKLQAAKEAKEALNEEFTSRMSSISEGCEEGDVQCSSQNMVAVFKEFSSKEKRPDAITINKAFNKYFANDFKLALKDGAASEEVLSTLSLITSEMPASFRSLKEKTIDLVRLEQMNKAIKINQNYVIEAQLKKANRLPEAVNYNMEGNNQRAQLINESQLMVNQIQAAATESSDKATLKYLSSVYLPNINKMINDLTNPNGFNAMSALSGDTQSQTLLNTATDSNQANQQQFSTRSNARGGGTSAPAFQGSIQNVNGNNTFNSNSSSLLERNGVSFGNTTNVPMLKRTGY